MQGCFQIGFWGKKTDILRVEAAYHELFEDSSGYLSLQKTKGFDALPDDGEAGLLISTDTSINVRFGRTIFSELTGKVRKVEAGIWWASLEEMDSFRSFAYSKAGSAKCKEWDDTIRTAENVTIFMPNGRKDPVVKLLLELYNKVPYNEDCTRAEPGSAAWDNWSYAKLPRTFEYRGKTYRYQDGEVRKTEDPYIVLDLNDYWELGCDEGDDSAVLEQFEDEVCRYWICGSRDRKWVLPDYMERLLTLNGERPLML